MPLDLTDIKRPPEHKCSKPSTCLTCKSNAAFSDEKFAKFVDPDYYKPRVPTVGCSLNDFKD